MYKKEKINMRRLLVAVTIIVSLCVFISQTVLAEKIFEGVELQYVTTSPSITADLDREFEKLTGAKVNVISVAWPDLHSKLVVPLASKQSTPDLFMFPDEWIGEFGSAGWFVPVDNYLTEGERSDLFAPAVALYTYNGQIVAWPTQIMMLTMFYNEKMLSKAGYEPAKTWDEFIDQSKAMQASGLAKYGTTWPLGPNSTLSFEGPFYSYYLSEGGSIIDEKGDPIFNNEKGVRALQWTVDTIFKFKIANPSSVEIDKRECLIPYMKGENPYNLNWQFMYPLTTNPETSSIAEYSKYCLVPVSKLGATVTGLSLGGAIGVNPYSKNKDAAIAYAKFITSKKNALKNFKEKGYLSWWNSFYNDPETRVIEPQIDILKTQLERSIPRPFKFNPWYAEYANIMGIEISKAWEEGISPKEILDNAVKKITELSNSYK